MASTPNQQLIFRTGIEQRFKEQLDAAKKPLPRVTEPAWYFCVSFANVEQGAPVGYLRRYDKGDQLLYPRAEAAVQGKVVGNVRFEQGRANFDGTGHIEFHITARHADELGKAELEETFLSPKPLMLMGSGQVDRTAYAENVFANPVMFYRNGQTEFGLFVPEGAVVTKINLEVLRAATGQAPDALGVAVWNSYIAKKYDRVQDGKRFRLVHDIMDAATLAMLVRREFFLYESFQVPLTVGATFYIGNAPLPGATALRGWIEDVIFDPTGSSGGGGGGGGKPEEF